MTLLALPGCLIVRRPLAWPEPSDYFETHVKQPDNHQCTQDCPMWPARYDGPVLLGRRGEEVR